MGKKAKGPPAPPPKPYQFNVDDFQIVTGQQRVRWLPAEDSTDQRCTKQYNIRLSVEEDPDSKKPRYLINYWKPKYIDKEQEFEPPLPVVPEPVVDEKEQFTVIGAAKKEKSRPGNKNAAKIAGNKKTTIAHLKCDPLLFPQSSGSAQCWQSLSADDSLGEGSIYVSCLGALGSCDLEVKSNELEQCEAKDEELVKMKKTCEKKYNRKLKNRKVNEGRKKSKASNSTAENTLTIVRQNIVTKGIHAKHKVQKSVSDNQSNLVKNVKRIKAKQTRVKSEKTLAKCRKVPEKKGTSMVNTTNFINLNTTIDPKASTKTLRAEGNVDTNNSERNNASSESMFKCAQISTAPATSANSTSNRDANTSECPTFSSSTCTDTPHTSTTYAEKELDLFSFDHVEKRDTNVFNYVPSPKVSRLLNGRLKSIIEVDSTSEKNIDQDIVPSSSQTGTGHTHDNNMNKTHQSKANLENRTPSSSSKNPEMKIQLRVIDVDKKMINPNINLKKDNDGVDKNMIKTNLNFKGKEIINPPDLNGKMKISRTAFIQSGGLMCQTSESFRCIGLPQYILNNVSCSGTSAATVNTVIQQQPC